jgi:hypothetical protein
MFIAPQFRDPQYWHERAEEARRMAGRMIDERAKQTMLRVAEEYDEFATREAVHTIEELAISRVIDETKGS